MQPILIHGLLVLARIVNQPDTLGAVLPAVIADPEHSSDFVFPLRGLIVGSREAHD